MCIWWSEDKPMESVLSYFYVFLRTELSPPGLHRKHLDYYHPASSFVTSFHVMYTSLQRSLGVGTARTVLKYFYLLTALVLVLALGRKSSPQTWSKTL